MPSLVVLRHHVGYTRDGCLACEAAVRAVARRRLEARHRRPARDQRPDRRPAHALQARRARKHQRRPPAPTPGATAVAVAVEGTAHTYDGKQPYPVP